MLHNSSTVLQHLMYKLILDSTLKHGIYWATKWSSKFYTFPNTGTPENTREFELQKRRGRSRGNFTYLGYNSPYLTGLLGGLNTLLYLKVLSRGPTHKCSQQILTLLLLLLTAYKWNTYFLSFGRPNDSQWAEMKE